MQSFDYPQDLSLVPDRIKGNGIEVIISQKEVSSPPAEIRFTQHALFVVLEGTALIKYHQQEEICSNEALMVRRNNSFVLEEIPSESNVFRCLFLFFDDKSVHYALDAFDTVPKSDGISQFKLALNENLRIFTASILDHYKNFRHKQGWPDLLQNKLRELIWIFFHSELKEQAFKFFRVAPL